MSCNLSWNHGILICGALILFTGEGLAGVLRIYPGTILFGGQNPTSEMNFSCTPKFVGGMDYLLGLELGKVSPDGTKSSVVKHEVTSPVETGAIVSNSTTQRSDSFTYILGDTGYLKYYLRNLRCSDVGTYFCASKMRSSTNVTITSTGTEKVRVWGGQDGIQMTVRPDRKAYNVDDSVEFTCSGVISSKFDEDMVKRWDWERMENKKWTKFMESDSRISINRPTPTTNCTFKSTLKYKIQSTDHGRHFRCNLTNTAYGATRNISLVGVVDSGNTKGISIAVIFTGGVVDSGNTKGISIAVIFTGGAVDSGNTKGISIAVIFTGVMLVTFFQP